MNSDTAHVAAAVAAAGVSGASATVTGDFPLSLFLWCLFGSFAGMGIAGPAKVREALEKLQVRAAIVMEILALGVGGVCSLLATSLLGYAVIGGIHVAGIYGIPFFGWAAEVKPSDLWPLGILCSAVLQVGAQKLLGAVVDVGVSLLQLFPAFRRKGDD